MKDLIKHLTPAERVAYVVHVVVFGGILLGLLLASHSWDATIAVVLSIATVLLIVLFRPILNVHRLFRRSARS